MSKKMIILTISIVIAISISVSLYIGVSNNPQPKQEYKDTVGVEVDPNILPEQFR